MVMEDDSRLVPLRDEEGNEYMVEKVTEFDSKDGSKHFVLIKDPADEDEDSVYPMYCTEDDFQLMDVTDPEDREYCAEILDALQSVEGLLNTNDEEKEDEEAAA